MQKPRRDLAERGLVACHLNGHVGLWRRRSGLLADAIAGPVTHSRNLLPATLTLHAA